MIGIKYLNQIYNILTLLRGLTVEIVSSSEDQVLCAEEYDGMLKQVKRPATVVLKAIDIGEWEVVEKNIENSKEACVIQHAIEVLESKWV